MEYPLSILSFVLICRTDALISDEADAARWFSRNNELLQEAKFKYWSYLWNQQTNITDHNKELLLDASLEYSEHKKESFMNASLYDWKNFQNDTLKRLFRKLSSIGISALEDKAKIKEHNEIKMNMKTLYSTAEVCKEDKCYRYRPDLYSLMGTSRDPDELLWAWKGWRDATGRKIKPFYQRFVEIRNEAARANGFKDTGEEWLSDYESSNFVAEVERLYEQLRPLYENLHAYVRRKLMETYGKEMFPSTGHVPAHLFGGMWAQNWGLIQDLVRPFKDKESIDITSEMVRQNYTVKRMFEMADEFFTSLGLTPMPETFWNKSMFVRPKGREVVCHATAWDFYNQKDFRIKQCTEITMGYFLVIHHEMGHIEYDLQYKHLPVVFRDGANPGFHEAIGDTMAISVATPAHLAKVGLLSNVTDDAEMDLNFLMSVAVDKIAFLPFGLLVDQWRWRVFSGETPPSHYNRDWWKLRCKYQGISPPVERTESDFDPGAKYHIPGNLPYIRYFVANVIQFQFHKALCAAAKHVGPLHKCDIYQSKAAGKKLGAMLKLGASKPWQDAMEIVTGQRDMDASAIIEYFKPLIDWLKEQNKGHDLGWQPDCPPGLVSGAKRSVPILYFMYILLALVIAVPLK